MAGQGQQGKDQGKQEQARQEEPRADPFAGVVAIELGDERNRNINWAPEQLILRGRWTRANLLPDEHVEQVQQFPDVPGMMVKVDGRRRRLEVFDPLADPKNKDLADEVAALFKKFFGQQVRPEPPLVRENATDSQVKLWLWHMHVLCVGSPRDQKARTGGPQARVAEGQLPRPAEIEALPGRIRVGLYDSSHKARNRYRE
ncbi:MAG TPA: hypothetical protein VJ739_12805, partial [Gemmataceae bacterium]|nr:hypothetical protein [Gemmataceae bacterium]